MTHAQETCFRNFYQKHAPMHVTKLCGLIGRLCLVSVSEIRRLKMHEWKTHFLVLRFSPL